jgi:hypothetical protein
MPGMTSMGMGSSWVDGTIPDVLKLSFRWYCNVCKVKVSPLANTFFSNVKIDFSRTLKLICLCLWYWRISVSQAYIHAQSDQKTAIDFYNFLMCQLTRLWRTIARRLEVWETLLKLMSPTSSTKSMEGEGTWNAQDGFAEALAHDTRSNTLPLFCPWVEYYALD